MSNVLNKKHKMLAKKQIKILTNSIRENIPLSGCLHALNLSYDDLVYTNYAENQYAKSPCRTLENFKANENNIPVVSFFTGAGGLDLGFETAGFSHLALFEINELFCKTLKHNRPHWVVNCSDIACTEKTIPLLKERTGSTAKFEGVFIGGPPCQPFSIAANQRFSKTSNNFKRTGFSNEKYGNLLFDYINLIIHFKPKVFLIENVIGLIDVDGGNQLSKAYKILEDSGYHLESPLIFKADSYYVPQQRVRLIIIGNRLNKRFVPPEPSSQRTNVSNVFDMPINFVKNHVTRKHNAESILRYMNLDYGQRDKLGRVDRLDPSVPSKTVIAGGISGGGRSHLHPYIPRTLSVRESARIQTFPDEYEFLGPVARQFTQVGNAVPPVLAAQIALAIYNSFYKA
jgi:DNA (cytosine-5)-methyltransferase 1